MPIKSYLLIPKKNHLKELVDTIVPISGCEVYPAENQRVVVLVTDTKTAKQDQLLLDKIENNQHLQHLSLIAGFKE